LTHLCLTSGHHCGWPFPFPRSGVGLSPRPLFAKSRTLPWEQGFPPLYRDFPPLLKRPLAIFSSCFNPLTRVGWTVEQRPIGVRRRPFFPCRSSPDFFLKRAADNPVLLWFCHKTAPRHRNPPFVSEKHLPLVQSGFSPADLVTSYGILEGSAGSRPG